MTFFGTGFTDTGVQSIVFKIGNIRESVPLSFDPKTNTFYCKVINFDSGKTKINEPV